METWINALKAPFSDTSTFAPGQQPTNGQIALVWGGIGLLISKVL